MPYLLWIEYKTKIFFIFRRERETMKKNNNMKEKDRRRMT